MADWWNSPAVNSQLNIYSEPLFGVIEIRRENPRLKSWEDVTQGLPYTPHIVESFQ